MRIFKTKPTTSSPSSVSSSPVSSTPPGSHLESFLSRSGLRGVGNKDPGSTLAEDDGKEVLVNIHSINKEYFDSLIEEGKVYAMGGEGDPVLVQLAELGDEYVHCNKLMTFRGQIQEYERIAQQPLSEEDSEANKAMADERKEMTMTEDDDDDVDDDDEEEEEIGVDTTQVYGDDENVLQEKRMVLSRQSLVQMSIPERRKTEDLDVTSFDIKEKLENVGVFNGPKAEWRISHSQVHNVEPDTTDDIMFHVFYYPKTKNRGNFKLSRLSFACHTPRERDYWITVFRRVLHEYWQLIFESRVIPAPEVYQYHLFMRKINRKGKEQIRLLIASDTHLYNVKYKPGDPDPKKSITRWILPMGTLTKINTYKRSPSSFGLVFDKKRAVKMFKNLKNMHEEYAYVCKDAQEKNRIVSELKRIYEKVTEKTLESVELASEAGKSKG